MHIARISLKERTNHIIRISVNVAVRVLRVDNKIADFQHNVHLYTFDRIPLLYSGQNFKCEEGKISNPTKTFLQKCQ